jgi:hypothetical protein
MMSEYSHQEKRDRLEHKKLQIALELRRYDIPGLLLECAGPTDIIVRAGWKSLLAYVVKDGRARLSFIKIGPALCHVVLVFKGDGESSVVKVIRCFHPRYTYQ